MGNKNNFEAYLYLLTAVMLWGGNWVAVRYAVQVMPPLVVVTIRSVLSALLLMGVLYLTRGKRLSIDHIKMFAVLGLVGLFGFNIFQYTGLKYTTAMNGSLINATTPIIIILLSRIIIKERLSWVQMAGVIISFLGVGWVITNGSLEVITSLQFNIGDIMMLLAAACWALYTIYTKKPTLEYSALYVTAYASIFAAAYFMPLGIVQFHAEPVTTFTWGMVAAFVYVIAVAVIGLVSWVKGVSIIGPSRASIFMNLMPIFTLTFAFLILGETLTANQIIGAVFVISGVLLTTSQRFALKSDDRAESSGLYVDEKSKTG